MEIIKFPNKLKLYRCCMGYSQKKVARLLKLADTSTLSRWEHGTALPSLLQVFRLAHIYHVQPTALFDELWDQTVADMTLLAEEPGTNTSHGHSDVL